ncbi:MAG: hypothetical protein AAF840_03510 [Bacteroidota bacterium]
MSNPNNPERDAWLRGEQPGGPDDEFARHAARGREELTSEAEAQDLLNELDGLLAERFGAASGVTNPAPREGEAAGAEEVEAAQQRPPAKVRRLGRFYAIAAAILLLLAAGSWWLWQENRFDAEAAYAEAFTPYANALSERTMGGDDSTATLRGELAEAFLAYDRRDYPAAVTAFAAHLAAPVPSPAPATTPQIQLYYGISQLGANQAEAASSTLEALRTDANYGAPASWYHALALLRSGQQPAAKTALEAISADTTSPFHEQAQRLLDEHSL